MMTDLHKCQQCGSEMQGDSPGGLCPACLLRIAVDADPDTLVSGTEPGVPSLVGTRVRYFGDYELLDEIARGGMGIVFRARQMSLNRIVAVKMMRPGLLASEAEIMRFRVEAEAAAGLQHPGIIVIHEVGEHEGLCYFSMDYVEGRSLAQMVREQPLPMKRAATYVREIAETVHYAHQQGVLHRDLKPANIIIDSTDMPRITDFGLARRIEGDPRLTETGAVVGTPCYMPPEQASGKRDQLNAASDVYSIGAILYELLTGRPPFQAETPIDTAMLVINTEPVSPRLMNPGLSRDIETICLKCLEKDQRKRYQSAQELADDLGRFLRNEPIKARPLGVTGRAVRWCKRNPWPAIAAGILALLAVVATYSAVTLRERLRRSLVEQARSERLVGNRTRSLELLGEAASMKISDDTRREAIQTITTPGVLLRQQIAFASPKQVLASPDSDVFVIAGTQYELRETRTSSSVSAQMVQVPKIEVWNAGNRQIVTEIRAASQWVGSDEFAISRDASIIATLRQEFATPAAGSANPTDGFEVRSQSITLINTATGEKTAEIKCEGDECREINGKLFFSPDGRRLVKAGSDCVSWVIDVDSGTGRQVCTGGTPVGFLSNDELLSTDLGELRAWNFISSRCRRLLAGRKALADDATVSGVARDGSLALISSRDSLILWDMRTMDSIGLVTTIGKDGADSLLSDDGKMIAVLQRNEPRVIHIYQLTLRGLEHRTIALGSNITLHFRSNQAAFSPDGSLLAGFGGEGTRGSTWIWDTRTGNEIAVLPENHSPIWTDRGRMLITRGAGPRTSNVGLSSMSFDGIYAADSGVNVWDVNPAIPLQLLPSAVTSIAFTRDGRQMLINDTAWIIVEKLGRIDLYQSPVRSPFDSSVVESGDQLWMRVPKVGALLHLFQLSPGQQDVNLHDPGYDGLKTDLRGDLFGSVSAFAISPDGARLVAATTIRQRYAGGGSSSRGENALELWDLPGARRLAVWNKDELNTGLMTIRFSPDGRLVATASNTGGEGIQMRDAETGKKTRLIRNPQLSYALIFSQDGKVIFSGGSDLREGSEAPVFAYDVETGREVARLDAHHTSVVSLTMSPDGKTLASGGGDGLICLWDVASRRRLAVWEAHKSAVSALSFSRDGKTIASGSADGSLKLWDLPFIRRELTALGLSW